jgi:HSP20 family protein
MLKNTNPALATAATRDPLQSLFNRLFGDAVPQFYTGSDTIAPATNVCESDRSYELTFELPGIEEKDIHVHLHDHVLSVTAERKEELESKDKRWHRVEHRYGQFARTIQLPKDATADGIEAVYRQGVLKLTVPKAPEAHPRKIEVRSA